MASVCVCYSTQTKTSERLAQEFAKTLNTTSEVCELVNTSQADDIDRYDLVCFFISSYGDGEPCDDGAEFLEQLSSRKQPLRFKYTMFGLGSSLYDEYQGAAKSFDSQLKSKGAISIGRFGQGDDGLGTLAEDYEEWKFDTLPKIAEYLGIPLGATEYKPSYQIIESDEVITVIPYASDKPPYHADKPYLAKCKFQVLNEGPCVKTVMKGQVELPRESRLKYTTGDHLGVYPSNSDDQVDSFLGLFGLAEKKHNRLSIKPLDRMTTRVFFPSRVSYWSLCKYFMEIDLAPTRKMVRDIAKITDCQALFDLTKDKQTFKSQVTDNYLSLARLLANASGEWSIVPFSYLLESLGPLRPRYYSISSSSKVQRETADLTVSMVEATGFEGVLTRNIRQLSVPAQLPVFIRANKFHLPAAAKDIVLICSGVGIAPFRGFIQERSASNNTGLGTTYVYWGIRDKSTDLLYSEEWPEYSLALNGKLIMNIAESRNGPKAYVQDLVGKDSSLIKKLIDNGAVIYVCGSTQMGKAVSKQIQGILSNSIKEGEQKLQLMKIMGRYREDVW